MDTNSQVEEVMFIREELSSNNLFKIKIICIQEKVKFWSITADKL
ncbi:hypothetical protein [Flavobacterium sp. LB2P44]